MNAVVKIRPSRVLVFQFVFIYVFPDGLVYGHSVEHFAIFGGKSTIIVITHGGRDASSIICYWEGNTPAPREF